MLPQTYKIEILDSTLTPITRVQTPVELSKDGHFLEYSSKLSNYGQAKFRVSTRDPLWKQFGDITLPYRNHVRIYRANAVVWQGVIVQNPQRNSTFIEVEAYEYQFLLSKVLIRHDTSGDVNYRTLKSGTMADAVQTFLTEAKADAQNILANLQIGSIENPVFPTGYVDFQNTSIAGQTWTFSDNFNLKFDYRDVLYVIQMLALYGVCDFGISLVNGSLVFDFKKFFGNRNTNILFDYKGQYGSIEDYDLPRNGLAMANRIIGVAADNQSNIITVDQSDQTSIATYGPIMDVAAYSDAKTKNLLTTRVTEELTQASTPDSEVHITLSNSAPKMGEWNIGDVVTVRIVDGILNFTQQRRIVATDVKVHNTGKEDIRIITNRPRAEQV